MNKLWFLLTLSILGGIRPAVFARQVNADRPGATYSSFTANAGEWMLESGMLINNEVTDLGSATLRYGWSEYLEIQAWAGSILLADGEAEWSNQGVAVKHRLGALFDDRMHFGMIGIAQTPVFGEGHKTTSEAILLNDISINSSWSLSTNIRYGGNWEDNTDTGFSLSTIPTYALSSKWALFGGYTVRWWETTDRFIEGGATFLVTPSLQVDAAFVYDDDLLTIGIGIVTAF